MSRRDSASVHLRLRGPLSDDEVTALRQQLATCLANGVTDIRVHVDEQTEPELRVLQVLQGAAEWLARRGGTVALVGAGSALVKTLKVYGLERLLASTTCDGATQPADRRRPVGSPPAGNVGGQ